MAQVPIYQFVKEKLVTHGVKNTADGLLTLCDQKLFSLFVDLERAARESSFDGVQSAAQEIENYLVSIDKRQLMAFTYMYLRFSDFTPKLIEADEHMPDGRVKKCNEYLRQVSEEEILIGLWARVKYDQEGEAFLRIVYASFTHRPRNRVDADGCKVRRSDLEQKRKSNSRPARSQPGLVILDSSWSRRNRPATASSIGH